MISKPALDLIDFRIIFIAMLTTILGTLNSDCSASSRASRESEAKPLSSTMPAIDGSVCAYSTAVAAPMLLPHSPIRVTFPEARR